MAALWSSIPTTREVPPARAHGAREAGAAGVEALVADLLVQAQRAPHARAREAPPRRQAGPLLWLPDVGEDAELPNVLAA